MNCLSTAPEPPSGVSTEGELMALAFGLGWAAADESHFPVLPEALAQVLGVSAARLAVVRADGTPLMEFAHPSAEDRNSAEPQLLYAAAEYLGNECTLRVSIESSTELTAAQSAAFGKAVRLIYAALDCILIRQRDRSALGKPFARLSAREWQVCQALEHPHGEKQIASSLGCSEHTLHSYVRSLYRKLEVQSRMQMLQRLRCAREHLRRRTLEGFAGGSCASRFEQPKKRSPGSA